METKYFQTLTRRFRNILTITRRDAMIVGSGRATIKFPNGTQVMIDDALFYPDYMYVPMKTTKMSFSLLLGRPDMDMKF
jgi:hypothetical protein